MLGKITQQVLLISRPRHNISEQKALVWSTLEKPAKRKFLMLGKGTVIFSPISSGTVDSAVTFNTWGPGFESSHGQLLLKIYLLLIVYFIAKNKKDAVNCPFKKFTDNFAKFESWQFCTRLCWKVLVFQTSLKSAE